MHVSVETTSGLNRKMTITVPSADFEGRLADRLKSTASKVSLPGFRRGKVPLKEVERRFGPSLRREVASEVVQSSFEDAVRERELAMVGVPSVELLNVEPGDDIKFTATFEVLPEIELADLSTLKVRKPVAEIGESDIDDMVESLRKQRVEWDPVDRPVADEDRVVVDYAVKIDGEVAEGGERKDLTFVVGAGEVANELNAAVVGMSVGETRAFPISVHRHHEGGHEDVDGVGEVVMNRVEAPSIPELDEAFFAALGVGDEDDAAADSDGDEDDAAADSDGDEDDAAPDSDGDEGEAIPLGLSRFRDSVRERMAADLEVAARNETKRQVMAVLARAHVFQIPRALLDEELEQEQERAARYMGVPANEVNLPEPIAKQVEDRVRTRLVVREIVNAESLTPDDERVRARIDELVAAYEKPEDVRNWIYADEDQLQRIELGVLEDQLVDHVLAQAAVEDVSASYKDVVTGRSIPLPAEEDPPTAVADHDHAHETGGHAPAAKKPRGLGGRLRRLIGGKP